MDRKQFLALVEKKKREAESRQGATQDWAKKLEVAAAKAYEEDKAQRKKEKKERQRRRRHKHRSHDKARRRHSSESSDSASEDGSSSSSEDADERRHRKKSGRHRSRSKERAREGRYERRREGSRGRDGGNGRERSRGRSEERLAEGSVEEQRHSKKHRRSSSRDSSDRTSGSSSGSDHNSKRARSEKRKHRRHRSKDILSDGSRGSKDKYRKSKSRTPDPATLPRIGAAESRHLPPLPPKGRGSTPEPAQGGPRQAEEKHPVPEAAAEGDLTGSGELQAVSAAASRAEQGEAEKAEPEPATGPALAWAAASGAKDLGSAADVTRLSGGHQDSDPAAARSAKDVEEAARQRAMQSMLAKSSSALKPKRPGYAGEPSKHDTCHAEG